MAKKHKDKHDAKIHLDRQIHAVKKAFNTQGDIDSEIDKLYDRIDGLLQKEKKLMGLQQVQQSVSDSIIDKVRLTQKKVDDMHDALESMHNKLDRYLHEKRERQQKIITLEEKIKKQAKGKRALMPLKNKVKKLESMYTKLKKKRAPNLETIKLRIETLKAQIALA